MAEKPAGEEDDDFGWLEEAQLGEKPEAGEGAQAAGSGSEDEAYLDGAVGAKRRRRGGDPEQAHKRTRVRERVRAQAEPAADDGSSSVDYPAGVAAAAADRRAAGRVITEEERERNARTLFVANLPFGTTRVELRDLLLALEVNGEEELLSIVEAKDKLTGKSLGYAHAEFRTAAVAQRVAKARDWTELRGRVVRLLPTRPKEEVGESSWQELPKEISAELKELLSRNPELKNISALRDAYERKAPGEPRRKLDVTKYGFKNFSTALRSVSGIELVKLEQGKGLTFVARLTEPVTPRSVTWRRRCAGKLASKCVVM